jgi:hypothetical protein
MPFLFKALEKMVQWRMGAHSASFHKDQHTFRKGHCTENALSHMVDTKESTIIVVIKPLLAISLPLE